MLIICGSHICKFTYWLKCICNLKINTHGTSVVIHRCAQSSKKSETPQEHLPGWGWTRWCPALFRLSYCKQYFPFLGLHGAVSFYFFLYLLFHLLLISLFKMGSKCSPEVLSTFPKCKKAVMCLTENICVLDKPCSGMGYSAVGCELNTNESTISIKWGALNRNTHKTKMWPEALRNLALYFP